MREGTNRWTVRVLFKRVQHVRDIIDATTILTMIGRHVEGPPRAGAMG